MGRPKGSRLTPEHREHISAGMARAWEQKREREDDFLSDLADAEEILDDLDATLAQARSEGHPGRAGRSSRSTIYNLDRSSHRELMDGLAELREVISDLKAGKVSERNAASVPFVSEHQTRHEPTTTKHSHDHAAYGEADHDDGLHFHEHIHVGDAHHNHEHTHTGSLGSEGSTGPVYPGGGFTDGAYGRMLNAATGPVERARLRRELDEQANRRLGL